MKKIAVLLSLAVVLAASPAFAATQNVFLAQGFNFYALTVTPADTDTIKDADTLFANVAEMNQLFRFNATTKAFEYKLRLPNGSLFGNNFALAAGTGYVFKTTAQKSVTFAGTAAATATSDLVTGFNFVGFPTVATVPTARGLLSTYATQLKSVFVWNYNTQAFQFVIRLDAQNLFGTDFEILPGAAFFVDAVSAVSVNFGAVTAPTDVNAAITGEIDGATIAAGAPSLAPSRALTGQFTVSLLKQDNTVVATVQADPTATGYAFSFTNVPAYTSYKVVAKGPNNEYVAGIVGQIVGNTAKNLNANTTALSLMIERDSSKFVTLLGSSASTYAAEETRLLALMANSLATVQANTERMRKLVATQGITLTDLRAGLLARVEIPIDLATQLAAYYGDPGKRAVEAMDAYKQAIALIGSQAGRENALYVEQALALLTGITGANLDSATYLALSAEEKKQVAVATAMAYNYKGDIEAKIGATTTQTAPARSFMAAYKSLGPSSVAHYEAYKKSLEILNKHKKNVPADQSDPALLGAQLKAQTPLAAEDPQYMQQASQTADALQAKIESDPALGGKVRLPGMDLDVIDVVEKKGEALQKGGNPAGAIEAFNKINENDASFDAAKKEKATKTKKFGIGKARMDMGDVENAFDDLKAAVGDVVTRGGVQEADYAKFAKINEALLAMAAVIEQLKAQQSTKFDQAGNAGYADPATIAQKMDKKSEIYVTVVVVVIAGGDTAPKFGDNVLQTVTDQNRLLLNEGMALMSEFHFQFQVQNYASALAALVGANGDAGALKKFNDVLAVGALTTAEAGTDETAKKNAINLRSQATLQAGLVHFFRFRVSILQKAKNDDHRKNALKAFYTVRDRYAFLATEVEERIKELERYENLVEEIQSTDFEKARVAVDQAVKLLKVGDKAKAFTLLEDAVAKYNAEYAKPDAAATLKKESLKGWAEAKFYRFFAYADGTADEKELKELVGMTEAVAALNLLRIRYSDLRSYAMDLQNRLTNAQLFAGQETADDETVADPAAIAGSAALPPVYNHAMKLKEQADQLYRIGDNANALAAFTAAKGLFDLMMVEATPEGRAELVKLLTDEAGKLAAVKTLAGIEIRNGFTAAGPRLAETNTLYWKIVAASAQKEEALLYARRYYAMRSDADRKVAVELLNRAIAKFPEVPFVAEIRQLIDELTGATTTNASAPILSNLKSDPAMLSYSANAQEITATVDAIDPDPAGEISSVKLSILFGGILQAELPMTNVPLAATGSLVSPVLQLHPGVNRQIAPAKGPRWTVRVPVPAGAGAGEYIFVAKAVNKAGVANELKGGFFLRPAENAYAISDLFIDPTGNLTVKLAKALPATDTQSEQLRVRLDVLQLPPAGVANVAPIPVAGYVNLPMQRADELTRTLPVATLFDAKFPYFGQFQISAKIVNLLAAQDQQVLFKRAMPYFRERAVDQTSDPSVVAFKEFLKIFNYDASVDGRTPAQRLAELKKFTVFNYAAGTLDPIHETIFDGLFRTSGKSVMTVNRTADQAPKDILEVEFIRPDYVVIHAFMKREQTYSANLAAPVFDAAGNALLPPGAAGYKFVKEEWMDFPLFLVNNRWYLAFGQNETAQGEMAYVENVYVNAQNVLTVLLTRPVDALKYKARLNVLQSPDPTRGIFVPRQVAGFEALELRPINATEVKNGETVTALLASEFALPMQTVIPATFPVYGPIEFAVRLLDAAGAEASTYTMAFYRQLPEFTAADYGTIKTRIGLVKTALEAKNLVDLTALCAVNGKANMLGAEIGDWYTSTVVPATPFALGIDIETLFLNRMDVNRAYASFDAGLPFRFEFVRLADGKWYWDTTPADYFTANAVPQIHSLYFGGNNDLVVRTSVGKTLTTPSTMEGMPDTTSNVAVKLAVLKPRADGSFQQVSGYVKPAFFYAGTAGNHEWKLALSQAIPQTFAEYGDLILEAQLYVPAETAAEPMSRMQMSYFRPFVSQSDAAIHAAAGAFVQILNDGALDKAGKLQAVRGISFGGTLGRIDERELPALIDALGATMRVVPDENSVAVHYPRPDFAELYAMAKFSGTYQMALPGGLVSPETGMQLLPPGPVGFELADFYAPVNLRFRLFNGQWLKTNDDPYMTYEPAAGGSYIMEAYVNENNALVVRAQEEAAEGKTYFVKAAIFTPPPVAMPGMGDVPVTGYESIDAVKAADGTWRVEPSRLFGANFPVFGQLVIAAQLWSKTGTAAPALESETRFPFFRGYQNTALETPVKTRFTAYMTALQSRSLTAIGAFWADNGALGALPQGEREQIEFVTSKINRIAYTVDQAQVFVQPLSPDRVIVSAMVETKFEYKVDEWMGIYHPVTGEQILPAGSAGAEQTFYRPFNLLFGQFKKPDNTFAWYLLPQGGAANTNPEITAMWQDATDNFVVNLNMARQDLRVRIELLQPPAAGSADYQPVPIQGFSGVASPLRAVVTPDGDGLSFTIPRTGDTGVFRPALQVYGDIILQAVLFAEGAPGTVLSTFNMPFYRPYEMPELVRAALINQYRASRTAFQNSNWNLAKLALQNMVEDPATLEEGGSVATAHGLIHGNLTGFKMVLNQGDMTSVEDGPDADFYIEPLGPDEAIVHCWNVKWQGEWSRNVEQPIHMPNGTYLLPGGGLNGQPFLEWRHGFRRMVRVNNQWRIRSFGFAEDMYATVGPVYRFGDIVHNNFEWNTANNTERLVAGIWVGGNDVPFDVRADLLQYDQGNSQYNTLASDLALARDLTYPGQQGVAYYVIPKADLIAGQTLVPNTGYDVKVHFTVPGSVPEESRESWNSFWHSDYVPLFDLPVSRPNMSAGGKIERSYGLAPDGRIAAFYDFGEIPPATYNTLYAYKFPGETEPRLYGPFVAGKVPDAGDLGNGYSDIARILTVTVTDANFDPWSVRSEADLLAKGFSISADGPLYFAPIVPQGAWFEFWPSGVNMFEAFANGGRVNGYLFDSDPFGDSILTPIPSAKLVGETADRFYQFMDEPAAGQINPIFSAAEQVSPIFFQTWVWKPNGGTLPLLSSLSELQAYGVANPGKVADLGHLFGRPIVELLQAGALPGRALIQQANGMAPTQALPAVPILKAMPQQSIQGLGFGWNDWTATRALFFQPATGNPITLVNNTDPAWSDNYLVFPSSVFSALTENTPGALVIRALDGNLMAGELLSNPFPVVIQAGEIERGDITAITGQNDFSLSITLPVPEPYRLFKTDAPFSLTGTGFGAQATEGMPLNRALVFVTGTQQSPVPWTLATNDSAGWGPAQIANLDAYWLPENEPGMLYVAPWDSVNWRPVLGSPLTVPVPVVFQYERINRLELSGVSIPPSTVLLADNDGAVDLTGVASPIIVHGSGFGAFVNLAAPERDLVFLPFSGAPPVPLAGNNLTGWTDSAIGPFTIPVAAQGLGVFKIRSVVNGTFVADEDLLVRLPGGVAQSVTIGQVNGQPATMGDPGTYVDRSATMDILGEGFGARRVPVAPATTIAPTRFLYVVNSADFLNASLRLILLDNTMAGWSEGALAVPASVWQGVTEEYGGGIFITDAPIVPGGTFNMISNLAMISFREAPQGIYIEQVGQVDVIGTSGTQSMPIDMTTFGQPNFNINVMNLPPLSTEQFPTYAIWWMPEGGSPVAVATNLDAAKWAMDGNGANPTSVLFVYADFAGRGQLFGGPYPMNQDFDTHTNHVVVAFPGGSTNPTFGFRIDRVNTTSAPFPVTPIPVQSTFELGGNFPAQSGNGLFFFPHVASPVPPIPITNLVWSTGNLQISSVPAGVVGEGHLMVGPAPYSQSALPSQLSNPVNVLFPGGTTEPTYSYLFSVVNGVTLSPSYDPNMMNAIVLPETGTFNMSGTLPDRALSAATHVLAFLPEGEGANPIPLMQNPSTNSNWSANMISSIPVQVGLAGQTGWIGIAVLPMTSATSIAKPVKVTFGGGTAVEPQIARINGLERGATAIAVSKAMPVAIQGSGFLAPNVVLVFSPASGGSKHIFMRDVFTAQFAPSYWTESGILIAPSLMTMTGQGDFYLALSYSTDDVIGSIFPVYLEENAPTFASTITSVNDLGEGVAVNPSQPLVVKGTSFPAGMPNLQFTHQISIARLDGQAVAGFSNLQDMWSTTQITLDLSELTVMGPGVYSLQISDFSGNKVSNKFWFHVAPPAPVINGVNDKSSSPAMLQGDPGLVIQGANFGAAGTLNYWLIFRQTGQDDQILTNNGSARIQDWLDTSITVPDASYFNLTGQGTLFITGVANGPGPYDPISNQFNVDFGTGLAAPPTGPTINLVGGHEQIAPITTGTPFSVSGMNFGGRVETGDWTRKIAIVDVQNDNALVWEVYNTYMGWNDNAIMGLIVPLGTTIPVDGQGDPHSLEIGIYDRQGNWISNPFNVALQAGTPPAINIATVTNSANPSQPMQLKANTNATVTGTGFGNAINTGSPTLVVSVRPSGTQQTFMPLRGNADLTNWTATQITIPGMMITMMPNVLYDMVIIDPNAQSIVSNIVQVMLIP